ncbi:polymer-forming cytoskeletal protein [Tengunoibacter tsumagoiensis]|uniref:Polymer-forming cytoskeletal protein n=1 Tax=Tengunoibacter tsumagoiensis TaxID=2014871 RepID=A0A402A4L9_9CHLR|nr:polymer-forming cytoskeletal protein [Tengunoibacter tsumagoiensis]GCE14104.1 hypothetical protein KTT_39630 [Tengunoibacter tsumagoiensis]
MQKVSQQQKFMLTLPGLLLIAAFIIGGGTVVLSGRTALAAGETHASTDSNACVGWQHKPALGGTTVVKDGEMVCGNVTSFGGNVVIHGVVNGDVVVFNGDVIIDGKVNGNLTLYGGTLSLPKNAHIAGDIHVCGGGWKESDNVHVNGNIFDDCTKSVNALLQSDVGANFRLWSIVTWVVLGVLLTTLLPEHVMLVRTTVQIKLRRSLILGLLSVLLAPVVLAVLIALIVSIPLAIIVALGLITAWALGTVAIGWQIGDMLLRKLAPQQNIRQLQVIIGVTALVLAGSLPYIGWLISLGAGLTGLGAVFLSRFGTRVYSQPRQPLPL